MGDKSRNANVTNEVVEVDGFDATKKVLVKGGGEGGEMTRDVKIGK